MISVGVRNSHEVCDPPGFTLQLATRERVITSSVFACDLTVIKATANRDVLNLYIFTVGGLRFSWFGVIAFVCSVCAGRCRERQGI